jgi:hypothetical protein
MRGEVSYLFSLSLFREGVSKEINGNEIRKISVS